MPDILSPAAEIEDLDEEAQPPYPYLHSVPHSDDSHGFDPATVSESIQKSSTAASGASSSPLCSSRQLRCSSSPVDNDWLQRVYERVLESRQEDIKREMRDVSYFRRVHLCQKDPISGFSGLKEVADSTPDADAGRDNQQNPSKDTDSHESTPNPSGASPGSNGNSGGSQNSSLPFKEQNSVTTYNHFESLGEVGPDFEAIWIENEKRVYETVNLPWIVSSLMESEVTTNHGVELPWERCSIESSRGFRDNGLSLQPSEGWCDEATVHQVEEGRRKGGRREGARLPEGWRQRARRACFRCSIMLKQVRLSRTYQDIQKMAGLSWQCSPSPNGACAECTRCLRGRLTILPCDSSYLQDRASLLMPGKISPQRSCSIIVDSRFIPEALTSHLSLSNVSKFIHQHVGSVSEKRFQLSVDIGIGRHIPFEALAFYPTPASELTHSIGVEMTSSTSSSRVVRRTLYISPVLAIKPMQRSVNQWLNDTIFADLDTWANWLGSPFHHLSWQSGVINAVCEYIRSQAGQTIPTPTSETPRPLGEDTLRMALKLSVLNFFMSHQLIISEEKKPGLERELGIQVPIGFISPRLVNKIFKMAMAPIIRRLAYMVLERLDSMIREDNGSATWGSAFCVTILLLSICGESEISLDDITACAIARGDFSKDRDRTMDDIIGVDTHLANVLIALFHEKFRTKEKDGFNPFQRPLEQVGATASVHECTSALVGAISTVTREHRKFRLVFEARLVTNLQ
jgi:hypothetical protein